jgi:hypothetical protein
MFDFGGSFLKAISLMSIHRMRRKCWRVRQLIENMDIDCRPLGARIDRILELMGAINATRATLPCI